MVQGDSIGDPDCFAHGGREVSGTSVRGGSGQRWQRVEGAEVAAGRGGSGQRGQRAQGAAGALDIQNRMSRAILFRFVNF